jgi:hypothetical protein
MDGGGRAGPARSETSPSVSSDPYSTIVGGGSTTLHRGNNSCCQQCYCSRARRGRHAFGVQRPIYFVSEVLSESKVQYPAVQKLLYVILIASRKLRHYFDEYKITVITDFPLADILHNQDATGRISKWAVELGALSIDFKPRTAIKSQALVDFMAEWRENQVPTPVDKPEHWTMYFDGSLKLNGGGAGVLLISP